MWETVLQRLGIPAVAFIPSAEVEGDSSSDEGVPEAEAHLSWADVRALPDYGIEVGSHAREHVSLGPMSRPQVRVQADGSRRELESHLQTPVVAFAYPFGTRADYNDMTAEVLREVGYRCVFTAQHGAIRAGAVQYDLPRVKVEGGEGLWMFKLIVRGGLDAWGWIDRVLWRVQRNYD